MDRQIIATLLQLSVNISQSIDHGQSNHCYIVSHQSILVSLLSMDSQIIVILQQCSKRLSVHDQLTGDCSNDLSVHDQLTGDCSNDLSVHDQ
jgi:hypothetical protein